SGPYVTGTAFTVGDIPIGLVVNRWFSLNFERPHYPAVARYFDHLSMRPAYMRHVRNGLPLFVAASRARGVDRPLLVMPGSGKANALALVRLSCKQRARKS